MSIKESVTKVSERFSALSNRSKMLIGVAGGLVLTVAAVAIVFAVVGPPWGGPEDAGVFTKAETETPPPAAETTGSIVATEAPKAEDKKPAAESDKPAEQPKAPATGGSGSGSGSTPKKGANSGGSNSGSANNSGGSGGGVSISKLPAAKQKAILADLEAAEKKADAEAKKKYPGEFQLSEYNTYYSELLEGYKADIASKHGVDLGELLDVELSRYK